MEPATTFSDAPPETRRLAHRFWRKLAICLRLILSTSKTCTGCPPFDEPPLGIGNALLLSVPTPAGSDTDRRPGAIGRIIAREHLRRDQIIDARNFHREVREQLHRLSLSSSDISRGISRETVVIEH